MAVYEILNQMTAGQQCSYNGPLREYLAETEISDETLAAALGKIAESDPDVRIVRDLKGGVKLDNISNRIIHYRDISKLEGSPVVYPYVIYASYDGADQAMLVLPYEAGGYLYARGYYYCMSEAGSAFYDARNEILEICTDNPDEIVNSWERLKKDKPGLIQRQLDRVYFRNYDELYAKAMEAGEDLKKRASEELIVSDDRAPLIASYIVRWFLLKKLAYVQYMVNKNIRSSVHEGDIHKQRNQARINADEIPFMSYRQMWTVGTDLDEGAEAEQNTPNEL